MYKLHALIAAALLVSPGYVRALDSSCSKGEQVVWACQTPKTTVSLCASRELTDSTGYLQYRVGTKTRVEFNYPATRRHPKGTFTFALLPRAVSVSFQNGGYDYLILEPLAGRTTVQVSKGEQAISSLECGEATDTLTLTSTINQFKAVGAFK